MVNNVRKNSISLSDLKIIILLAMLHNENIMLYQYIARYLTVLKVLNLFKDNQWKCAGTTDGLQTVKQLSIYTVFVLC